MEGRRLEKTPSQPNKMKWGAAIAALAAVAAVSAYLGLCSWVGSSQKILPNVSVAGVDVSGMDAASAWTAVEQAVTRYGPNAAVTLNCGGWSGTLSCADLQQDYNACVSTALSVGRGSFLTQGAQYLGHLFGGSSRVGLDTSVLRAAQPALDRLLEQADEEIGGGVRRASWQVEDEQVVLTKGWTGTSLDRDGVLLVAATAANQAMEQAITQGSAAEVTVDLSERTDLLTTAPPETPEFDGIHRELYREAESAGLDPETFAITDHTVGVDFDPSALQAAYESAAEGETVSVPLTYTQPKDTRDSLQDKLFRDLLGEGTTNVSGTANRKNNVKLSAEACNGIVLLPGEEFSYNNTTGSRSADKGYLNAPVYKAGASVDDIGGGICQTSSTIYYAVLHTTLEVVERHDHQFNTGYVTTGMDATVYFGHLDFRFKNNTDYPIKIVTRSYDQDGKRKLNVKIYGTNEAGTYAVPRSTVSNEVPPTNKYVADSSVPQGTLVLDRKQHAYTGRKAHTYRDVFDMAGNLLETQDMGRSSYQMRPNLYYYNPLDGDPSTWVDGKPPAPGTAAPETPQTPAETGGTETGGGTGGEQTSAEPEPSEPEAQTPAPQPAEDQPAPEDGLGEGESVAA